MFFKRYFNGLSETIDIKYKSSLRKGINSADVGELCEIFMKDFLYDCLDDHYQVFRGGNIINVQGDQSPQLDIVLTNRNTLKIFGDKGIYPIETVIGVFSITSRLTISKLNKCIREFARIPKHHYGFSIEAVYGEKFKQQTEDVWRNLIPFNCIFAYNGKIKSDWVNKINAEVKTVKDHSLLPSLIVVNKIGMLEKETELQGSTARVTYRFSPLVDPERYGEPFSKMLFHLYTLSGEQHFRRPKYENYFRKDYE